jgi:hypothetical protein
VSDEVFLVQGDGTRGGFFSRKRQCEKGLLELVNFARVNGGLKGKVSKGKLEKGELHKAKASKDVSQRTI